MASEAIIWNNNFNDEQSADTITGTVAGTHGTGMNTLSAHSIQQYAANSRDVGRAQWAIGDQFTVPLCVKHHNQLHNCGMSERHFWEKIDIDPLPICSIFYKHYYDMWKNKNFFYHSGFHFNFNFSFC